jgi:uncharacterized repeat protein (TIGR03803 family)
VLHSFNGSDGAEPYAGLADSKGDFYGTTRWGGASGSGCGGNGCGTVFKLSRTGAYTLLHSFSGSDGAIPQSSLIADKNGNLYGTTYYGGASLGSGCGGNGCGTVFKLSPNGTYSLLHSFYGGASDGANPQGNLMPGITAPVALANF